MSEPLLYRATTPSLEKRAYAIKLEKDPKEWPISILKEAYKQVPYIRSYEVDVELDRTDDARGYAVGKMLVYPARMKKEAASKEDRLISFPVIVRDHELSPLDVISYKDEMHPAHAETISEILFRPEMFERTGGKSEFGATELRGQLDPPSSSRIRGTGFQKTSSVSLWKTVLPTIKKDDIQSLRDQLNQDPTIRMAALSNPAFGEVIDEALSHQEKTAEEVRELRESSMKPTTVQFFKDGMKYFVKTANHNCYNPLIKEASRFEVQKSLSKEDFIALLDMGYRTFTVDPVSTSADIFKEASAASRTGIYTTYNGMEEINGIVIPKMIDIDGRELSSQLFIGGDSYSMQEKIAGAYVSDVTLPSNEPRGHGVFVHQVGPMSVATEPIHIRNKVTETENGEKLAFYVGTRSSNGTPIRITKVPGLQKIASIGEYDIAVPEEMRFVRLEGKRIKVQSSASTVNTLATQKVASANTVELISDGNEYQLRGTHLNKIANRRDTAFTLSALGLSRKQTEYALEKSASDGSYRILRTRNVVTEEDYQMQTLAKLKDLPSVNHLKVDLVKEASVIVEKETADTILSLKFITPENVGVFVNFIPELEKVSSKLAEVLTASRLGLDDVKESAAKNAMTQIIGVIEGLKNVHAKIS